jgi:ElaB/YqjD/DUF883 family membrane-anchored ribosome-binding protein
MNETNYPDGNLGGLPLPTRDPMTNPMSEPAASVFAHSEQPTPALDAMLNKATQGSHDTVDRLAASAKPVLHDLGESAAAAERKIRAKAEQLRETGNEWADSARTKVRDQPLTALATALAVGLLIARLVR